MSHPLCPVPEPEPPTCDPNTQSCPPPAEVCGDGMDNDGDGFVDEDCTPVVCVPQGVSPYCIRTDQSCHDFAFNHLCIREGETDSFSVRCAPFPYNGPTSDTCPLVQAPPGSTYSISAGVGTWTWTNAAPPGTYLVLIEHPCCFGLHTLVTVLANRWEDCSPTVKKRNRCIQNEDLEGY